MVASVPPFPSYFSSFSFSPCTPDVLVQIVGGLQTHLDGIAVRVGGGDEREEVGQSLARSCVRVDDHVSVLGQQTSDRRYLNLAE